MPLTDPDSVRIIPLGGVEEVGKNMTAVETADDILIFDAGFQFVSSESDAPELTTFFRTRSTSRRTRRKYADSSSRTDTSTTSVAFRSSSSASVTPLSTRGTSPP
jgi:hypothetical protein